MVGSAAARDRLYRKLEPLLGPDDAAYPVSQLAPVPWDQLVTKADLRAELAELRAEMVTKRDLAEQLRLHVDARLDSNTRATLMWSVAMNATMLGAVIAAIRL